MALTGFVATEPDFSGSTPSSLRDALSRTAVNGLNRFIDLELSERFGLAPTTQADVHSFQPATDPSNPEPTPAATRVRELAPVIGIGLAAAALAFLLFKAL